MQHMNSNLLEEIFAQLRRQSEGTKEANDMFVLADYIWMLKNGQQLTAIEPIWLELVEQFDHLNRELKLQSLDFGLPRQVVYTVNGLVIQCLECALFQNNDLIVRQQLLQLGWQISCAWDAIVAGDIDNIMKHVELELKARNLVVPAK